MGFFLLLLEEVRMAREIVMLIAFAIAIAMALECWVIYATCIACVLISP